MRFVPVKTVAQRSSRASTPTINRMNIVTDLTGNSVEVVRHHSSPTGCAGHQVSAWASAR
jgi:hypothetical protein